MNRYTLIDRNVSVFQSEAPKLVHYTYNRISIDEIGKAQSLRQIKSTPPHFLTVKVAQRKALLLISSESKLHSSDFVQP